MNIITVGTVAMIAGLGLGVGVTTTIKTQNIEAEVVAALRAYDAERRQRDAAELAALKQREIEQTERQLSDAMKGWGEMGGKTK